MKKARLAKKGSEAYEHNIAQNRNGAHIPERRHGRRAEEREQQRESFNPPRAKITKKDKANLVKLDGSLAQALVKYQHSLNDPECTDELRRRLKRKARVYTKRIQAILQAQNTRTPDRKVIRFFYVDADVARKKDCKLPKRVGYGLRVAAKNNNPKRGRAVLPIVNPAYVVSRNQPTDKLPKLKRDRHTAHVGYIWEKPGHGNGNGKE